VSAPRLPLATRALSAALVTAARDADLPDEAIHLADEAVSWAPGLSANERRAFGLVVLALESARDAGATRLPLSALAEACARLDADGAAAREASALVTTPPPGAAPLFGAAGDYKPFIVDDGCLYAHRDLALEERLARALAARIGGGAPAVEEAAVEAALAAAATPGRSFNAGQTEALRAALTHPLAVITGGPGTGKTAVLVGVVRALRALGLRADEIALAAPTGRAANRIAESLGAVAGLEDAPTPQTLHRLLGYRGGRAGARGAEFRHHENYLLPHAAVLVDEASMIDLALMERLTRALRPDARLVLVGDADQLPSVDAGAVFRELTAHARRLTQSHRQDPSAPAGASVLAAASAVHAGDAAPLTAAGRARPADLTWSGFEHLSAAAPGVVAQRRLLAAFVEHWAKARLRALPQHDALAQRVYRLSGPPGAPFADDDAAALLSLTRHHQSLRVLTVTRGAAAPTGAEALNLQLARHLAPEGAAEPVAPGAPAMMIRNDYDRGLFNGDLGVVVRAAADGEAPRLFAVFPRGAGLAAFPYEALRDDLRLAYATTVHKAQGAELDHVALVLPERDLPLLSRELIYTALTRARHSAVVVGRADLLALAVSRPLARASGLAARITSLAI
jgi:exodeoxyribonuclease V alpha subunit